MVETSRSSRLMLRLTAEFKAECQAADARCWLCLELIDYEADGQKDDYAFHLDHFWPWGTHPNARADPGNFRASHRLCNIRRGDEMPRPELGEQSRDWFGTP